MCFDFLYNVCLRHFSFLEELSEIWSNMYIGLRVKYPLFLSEFNETWTSSTDFLTTLKYKISWSRVVSTRTDGRTDMTKLVIVFRNFVHAPKNCMEEWLTQKNIKTWFASRGPSQTCELWAGVANRAYRTYILWQGWPTLTHRRAT